MPGQPLTAGALTAYRDKADRFEAELLEEYYLNWAGHKPELAIEPIFERYAELMTLDAALDLEASVDGDPGPRELWHFACSGYLDNLTKSHDARVNELEASLEAAIDGTTVPYRMLRPRIANEPDRDRRRLLEEARCALGDEHFNPVHEEAARIAQQGVRELGAVDSVELHRRFGFRLDELGGDCRALLEETEELYEDVIDPLFRERVGVSLEEAERWDVPRLFRAQEWDQHFPAAGMLPALEATLDALGVDLRAQPNIELDVEQREMKQPRAFCAPIEVPERVMLVIQPIGGAGDWRALFHEAGHAEHFACTSADLTFEERRLGDNAVTEGWAALFDGLIDDARWLTRRLDFPDPQSFQREGGAELLWYVRRYCAKLLYELELFRADDPTSMRGRYVEILGGALRVEPSPTDWLADVDSGFYVTEYLRSWAFEAQLRFFLLDQYGSNWFAKDQAGRLLRDLWSLGQKPTADDLLRDVTGAALEMASVAERAREML